MRRSGRSGAGHWALRLLGAIATIYVAAVALYYGYSRPWPLARSFNATLAHGNLSEWDWTGARQLCCAWSARVVDNIVGARAVRVELRADDPHERGSTRAELRFKSAHFGATYDYRAKILIPPDWQADPLPTTLLQWHNVPDVFLLEAGTAPPLRLAVIDNEFLVVNVWDRRRISRFPRQDITTEGFQLLARAPLARGRWSDFRFRVRWSTGADGRVEVWLNGHQIGARRGPNAINDVLAPYYKFGIYVPAWADGKRSGATRHVAYFTAIAQSARE